MQGGIPLYGPSGSTLQVICAPGVKGHQGNPRNCVRLLVALNAAFAGKVDDCPLYFSTPPMVFSDLSGRFRSRSVEHTCFYRKTRIDTHGRGRLKYKGHSPLYRRPTHWWSRTCRECRVNACGGGSGAASRHTAAPHRNLEPRRLDKTQAWKYNKTDKM